MQTYRIDGVSEAAGDGARKVGGELPSNEDAAANSGAQTLASLQGTDLDADGILLADLQERLERDIVPVSAVTGQGTRELCEQLWQAVEAIKRPAPLRHPSQPHSGMPLAQKPHELDMNDPEDDPTPTITE